jgi:hypothetical protein
MAATMRLLLTLQEWAPRCTARADAPKLRAPRKRGRRSEGASGLTCVAAVGVIADPSRKRRKTRRCAAAAAQSVQHAQRTPRASRTVGVVKLHAAQALVQSGGRSATRHQ